MLKNRAIKGTRLLGILFLLGACHKSKTDVVDASIQHTFITVGAGIPVDFSGTSNESMATKKGVTDLFADGGFAQSLTSDNGSTETLTGSYELLDNSGSISLKDTQGGEILGRLSKNLLLLVSQAGTTSAHQSLLLSGAAPTLETTPSSLLNQNLHLVGVSLPLSSECCPGTIRGTLHFDSLAPAFTISGTGIDGLPLSLQGNYQPGADAWLHFAVTETGETWKAWWLGSEGMLIADEDKTDGRTGFFVASYEKESSEPFSTKSLEGKYFMLRLLTKPGPADKPTPYVDGAIRTFSATGTYHDTCEISGIACANSGNEQALPYTAYANGSFAMEGLLPSTALLGGFSPSGDFFVGTSEHDTLAIGGNVGFVAKNAFVVGVRVGN